ncbi:MAG TPA: hypothetical protein VGU90_05920 [Terriglobales bacterium]|nr:hypothetical protein [Terriglobales bacterium]
MSLRSNKYQAIVDEEINHELLLLWVVTPAGLDGFFRDTCSPPGVPPKQLTKEQIREIALRKYATGGLDDQMVSEGESAVRSADPTMTGSPLAAVSIGTWTRWRAMTIRKKFGSATGNRTRV